MILVQPENVSGFDADLNGPQSIRASWIPPLDGAPVDGYKVTYWSRPGTVKMVELKKEVNMFSNFIY